MPRSIVVESLEPQDNEKVESTIEKITCCPKNGLKASMSSELAAPQLRGYHLHSHSSHDISSIAAVRDDAFSPATPQGAVYITNMNGMMSLAPNPSQQYLRQVFNREFSKALLAQKPKPFTAHMLKLYGFLFIGFLTSCINGYDGSIMAGINAMWQYQNHFHMRIVGSTTGIVFAIYTLGQIVGSFMTGPLVDHWGRRWGMFTASLIIIIGATIQASANHRAVFLGGRLTLGFGCSIITTAGPVYVAEMAHPAWRGTLTGLYNTFYFVGAIAAAWVMYGTERITSDLAWRLPVWLQLLPAGLVVLFSLFCPETPRWLIANNFKEEAVRVLARYHGDGDRKSPIVLLSYKEMVQEIILEGSDKRFWDFSELWSSEPARWRSFCVIGMAFFGQWSGNGAVTYFLPVLLDRVGINDQGAQLLHNAILYVLQFFSAVAGALCVDKLGRRRMLLFGTALFIIWWSLVAALTNYYAVNGRSDSGNSMEVVNKHGAKATIAFIFLFGLTHAFAYTSLQILYPVECLRYETRAKGMGMLNLMVNIALIFNSYGMATIIEKIGWGFCFIYIVWDTIEFIVIYFFFVETKGRTLEELSEIFNSDNPRAKSLETHVLDERDILWSENLQCGETGEEYNFVHTGSPAKGYPLANIQALPQGQVKSTRLHGEGLPSEENPPSSPFMENIMVKDDEGSRIT